MKKYALIYYFVLFTIISSCGQVLRPITSGKEFATPFVNTKGKTAFTLPSGHILSTNYPGQYYWRTYKENIPTFQMDTEKIIVQHPDNSIYWVNGKGEKIKDFGEKYFKMSRMQEGYTVAWEKKPYGDTRNNVVYLNEKGEKAFLEKKYWKAFPFYKGMALVQEEKNGQWVFINYSGEAVLKMEDIDARQVYTFHGFSNGFARVDVKAPEESMGSATFFINTAGKKVLNYQNSFPNRKIVGEKSIGYGHLLVYLKEKEGYEDNYIIINEEGEKVLGLAETSEVYVLGNEQFLTIDYIDDEHNQLMVPNFFSIVNKSGVIKAVEWDNDMQIDYENGFTDGLFEISYKKGKERFYSLYDFNLLKEVFQSKFPSKIKAYDKDIVIVENHDTRELIVHSILTGEKIWEMPPENRWFQQIEDAISNKNEVKFYKMINDSDFENGLFQLKNLTHLIIDGVRLKNISAKIKALKKLKSLVLMDLPKLEALPKELADLKSLEVLKMEKCPNYKNGLEYIVENATTLKSVNLEDIKLEKGFIEKMRKINPNLKITLSNGDEINFGDNW